MPYIIGKYAFRMDAVYNHANEQQLLHIYQLNDLAKQSKNPYLMHYISNYAINCMGCILVK